MKYNEIILVGRITKDPECKQTPSGTTVANFSLAVGRNFKNKQTNEYDTDFFNCTSFGDTAELIVKYGRKGKLVLVNGQMHSRKWTSQSGENHTSWDVSINKFQFMDKLETEQHDYNVSKPVSNAQNNSGTVQNYSNTSPKNDTYDLPKDYDPFADEDIDTGGKF